MNTLATRLLSLLLFAALCATLAYWSITLTRHQPPLPAAAAPQPIQTADAATLFGGQLTHDPTEDIHLFGILSLAHGAAAIIGTSDAPARAIALNDTIMPGATLAEVRPHSIVVAHNGIRREVQLPAVPDGPAIYVR